MAENKNSGELVYQILCDDVRLEIGNKLSLIGVFQDIFAQGLPIMLPKMAIVTQWRGEGDHSSEVRILSPDRKTVIAHSPITSFQIPKDGYANNIAFFINLQLDKPGLYLVQTFLDTQVNSERIINVGVLPADGSMPGGDDGMMDETLN